MAFASVELLDESGNDVRGKVRFGNLSMSLFIFLQPTGFDQAACSRRVLRRQNLRLRNSQKLWSDRCTQISCAPIEYPPEKLLRQLSRQTCFQFLRKSRSANGVTSWGHRVVGIGTIMGQDQFCGFVSD